MKLPASDTRKITGPIISSGCAARFMGLAAAMRACASGGLLRTMSVSIVPGASALTRMPCGAHSRACARVNDIIADLAPEYIDCADDARNAPAEITFTTAAWGLAMRCGSAYCTRNTGPRRFTL